MAWSGERPRKAEEFSNISHSILLVEVANSEIEWTEPRDLVVEATGPTDGNSHLLDLSSQHARHAGFFLTYNRHPGINVAIADGTTYYVPSAVCQPRICRRYFELAAATRRN